MKNYSNGRGSEKYRFRKNAQNWVPPHSAARVFLALDVFVSLFANG